jgi:hypothetical protein
MNRGGPALDVVIFSDSFTSDCQWPLSLFQVIYVQYARRLLYPPNRLSETIMVLAQLPLKRTCVLPLLSPPTPHRGPKPGDRHATGSVPPCRRPPFSTRGMPSLIRYIPHPDRG